jgi:HD-GYP domain-containing protein (c-di-GMP phosphodiesterase class II)
VAFLLQLVAVLPTVLLVQAFPAFRFQGVLAILVVLFIALIYGVGPSVLAALAGAALLWFLLLPPVFSLTEAQLMDVLGVGLYVGVGLTVSLMARQTQRVRRHREELATSLAVERARLDRNHPEGRREEAMLVSTVEALVTLVEARDYSTGRHCQQVADLVLQLARVLGLPTAEAQLIALAGRLHDVGKVAIPDAVLQKPGRLTEEEWELMRTHPAVGADVVSHIPGLRPLVPLIRAHHERWDGQGYPDHLKGEAIPLGARILMVVDAYVAMTVDRPYQPARAPAVALAELCRCAGSQFDPQVVMALEQILLAERGVP